MDAERFFKQIESRIRRADKLVRKRRYEEAREIYEQEAALLRELRESQRSELPGPPNPIPLTLRLLMANRYLVVPLDRLGELHLKLGGIEEAYRCFREVVEALEEAERNAGGKTRDEIAAMLATARRKAAEAAARREPGGRPR